MPSENNQTTKEQPVIDQSDPCYCPACGKLTMSSFPVHLREKDGTDTLVCKIVKCAICDRIKHYGTSLAIGKLKGRVMFADYENWPELQRNDILPDDFIDAILANPKGHIWLDANNGLQPVRLEGTQETALKRWEAFIKRQGRFWRAYD